MRERRMQANNNTFRSLYGQSTVPRRRTPSIGHVFFKNLFILVARPDIIKSACK
jgi:hypothetical protein